MMTGLYRATSFAAALTLSIILIPAIASAGSAKPIARKQAAAQYLRDVDPFNASTSKFSAALSKWGKANGTASQTTSFVRPYVASFTLFDRELLRQRWPAKASDDVRSLVLDDAACIGDLDALPSVSVLNASQWSAQISHDENVSGAAADFVRSDLGLPLAKK